MLRALFPGPGGSGVPLIRARYGAVGKYGGLALIERFIGSLKDEGLRSILLPLRERTLRKEVNRWAVWFNQHRAQTGLGGKTPGEAYRRIAPANKRPRWEPRKRWPSASLPWPHDYPPLSYGALYLAPSCTVQRTRASARGRFRLFATHTPISLPSWVTRGKGTMGWLIWAIS